MNNMSAHLRFLNKLERGEKVNAFLSAEFNSTIDYFECVNVASYELKLKSWKRDIKIYPTTLKVVERGLPTFQFETLEELKTYILGVPHERS